MEENITPKIENPREEIDMLKEKVRTLEEKYEERDPQKERPDILKEALKDHIQEAENVNSDAYKLNPQQIRQSSIDVGMDSNVEEQLQALFDIVQKKGILNAFSVARALNNPYLMDSFHDLLVENYDKILEK